MRKYIVVLLLLTLCASQSFAQSMTDEQVMEYVLEQHEKGVSQSEIVAALLKRGVTTDQLKRIKKKYESEGSTSNLGSVNLTTTPGSTLRTRENNGDKRSANISPYRTKDGKIVQSKAADMTNPEFLLMQRELSSFLPDSSEILDQMYLDQMMPKDEGRKIFGHDIFNNESLSFEPNMNIATPQDYLLGPGDEVYIDIYGASQKTITSNVSPEGNVTIEGFGPVHVTGLTVSEAGDKFRETLGSRYANSTITLSLGQTRTISVHVMGEVTTPGTFTLSAFSSVFHALYMAGGVNEIGTLRNIKVYRDNRLISTVDIYDYILNGNLKGNVRLSDGDVIVVGPYECLVNVTGKVKRPMFYEMKRSESVGTLLTYAGGFAGDAYKKSIRLVRKAGAQYSVYTVGEFDMNTFRLEDEDSLDIDSVIPRFSNMVEVRGAVFRPGMYQYGGDITTVRSLLTAAEGVTEDAFTARGVMHRMKADRTLEVVSVDIAGILDGTVADVPLKNEDVLYVPSKKELQEEQTLTIHGEVMYPGVYKYAENETIEDFILQAGGLTDAASVMKVDVARRMTDSRATESSDIIAQTYSFSIKDGFVIDGTPGLVLLPYDEVYVRSSPGYTQQQNIKIEGEVLYSGTYTLSKKNQRLSEMIEAAGGLTETAYAKGARLERTITTEERLKMEDVKSMLLTQSGGGDTIDVKKFDFGSTYYVAIDLEEAMRNPGSDYDVILREGDRIIVPEFTSTVKISGDVMSPTTVAYMEGEGVKYYINQAGGYGLRAKKNRSIMVYMNGTRERIDRHTKVLPGSEIIVPSKQAAQKLTRAEIVAIGTGAASIATMIATIASIL